MFTCLVESVQLLYVTWSFRQAQSNTNSYYGLECLLQLSAWLAACKLIEYNNNNIMFNVF